MYILEPKHVSLAEALDQQGDGKGLLQKGKTRSLPLFQQWSFMQEVNFQSVSIENTLKGLREYLHAISKGQAVFPPRVRGRDGKATLTEEQHWAWGLSCARWLQDHVPLAYHGQPHAEERVRPFSLNNAGCRMERKGRGTLGGFLNVLLRLLGLMLQANSFLNTSRSIAMLSYFPGRATFICKCRTCVQQHSRSEDL